MGDAPGDRIDGEHRRRLGRQDLRAAGEILLERIVLQVDGVVLVGQSLLLAERCKHRGHDGADRVAQCADALHRIERKPVEQRLHVGERVDGDTDAAHLAGSHDVVAVVTALRRKIERKQQLLDTQLHEPFQPRVAGVRLSEAGVGGDDERLFPVHRRIIAAGIGKLARKTGVAQVVEPLARQRCRAIERLDRNADIGVEAAEIVALADGGIESLGLPALMAPDDWVISLPRWCDRSAIGFVHAEAPSRRLRSLTRLGGRSVHKSMVSPPRPSLHRLGRSRRRWRRCRGRRRDG